MKKIESGLYELDASEMLSVEGGRIAKWAGMIVGHLHNAVDWCAENLSSNTSSAYLTQI